MSLRTSLLLRAIGLLGLLGICSEVGAQSHTPGEVIVRLSTTASRPTAGSLGDLAERFDLRSATSILPSARASAKPANSMSGVYLLRFGSADDPADIAQAYAENPSVIYAEPNYLYRPVAAPNDPRFAEQTALAIIGFEELRDNLGPKKREVILAVIDSGVDIRHKDLADAIWQNPAEALGVPGVDDDANGYIDDVSGWDFTHAPGLAGKGDFLDPDADVSDESGHGTQVAGVALAVTDNGIGIAGVSDARLMPLRAGLDLQSGESVFEEDDLAAALIYAADNGAHVINLSWGGPENARLIRDAVRYARLRGAIVIASAGNSGTDGVLYPGQLDETIAIGATGNGDDIAGFSSRGNLVDLVAPGVSVLSTLPGGSYGPRSGTSFSAPIISGVAALLLSRFPEMDAETVTGLLVSGTVDLGTNGWDREYGAGRFDGPQLLAALGSPSWGRIDRPRTGEAGTSFFDVTARTSASGHSGYRVSWGAGKNPSVWNQLSSGPPGEDIELTWDLSNVPEGDVVLRLEIDASDGRTQEDRAELHVGSEGPVISEIEVVPVYQAERSTHRISWTTDVPAEGAVILTPLGHGGDDSSPDTLRTPHTHTRQRLILPTDLLPGERTVAILAVTPDGRETVVTADTVDVRRAVIPSHGFSEIGLLPHAFLPDNVADFDGDGRIDLALMPYIDGEPFSVVQIFERTDEGSYESVHTTEETYLPWNVGDADNDGAADILGTTVAQIRLFTGEPFPDQKVLDMLSTWGGEIADLDDDGENEILARAQVGRKLVVLKHSPGSGFDTLTEITDPTSGSGAFGTRFVTGDLDSDGLPEVLVGDADGDLWISEWNGSTFTTTWSLPGEDDVRWVGGGRDLDGDGDIEFAALRAREDFDDLLNGYWQLEIYGADGDNTFTLEFVAGFTGVITSGNGIASGDVDGDGKAELVVCARPDLYVFTGDADQYTPVWHAPVSLLHRPLVADLDGDGVSEIVYNAPTPAGDVVRIVGHGAFPITAPLAFVNTWVIGPDRIQLEWTDVATASGYDVERAIGDSSFLPIAENLQTNSVEDTGLQEGVTHRYRVTARLPGSPESNDAISEVVALTPMESPRVTTIDSPVPGRLQIRYSRPMSADGFDPERYWLDSGGGIPTSVAAGAGFQQATLAFENDLDLATLYRLHIRSVADTGRVLFGGGLDSVPFYTDSSGPVLAADADFDGDKNIGFGDFLLFAQAFGGTNASFDLDGDGRVLFSDFLLFAILFDLDI